MVSVYEEMGPPSWFWLDPDSGVRTAVPMPPDQEVEERVLTRLHACTLENRAPLGTPYQLRLHDPDTIRPVAWGEDWHVHDADFAPHGEYLSIVGHLDGKMGLRVVASSGGGWAGGVTDVALPDGCISPEQGWHHSEPLLWVMCAAQARALTMNAETQAHRVVTVTAESSVLGWRGSPPELLLAVNASGAGQGAAPGVRQVTSAGLQDIWAGLGSLYLPQRDLLFVERASRGDWMLVDLAAASSSPWPPAVAPRERSIAASSRDGRWVALREGGSDSRGPDLRLVEVETGASRIIAEGEDGSRITTVEFCPPPVGP